MASSSRTIVRDVDEMPSDKIILLGQLSNIYQMVGDISSQQNTIQQIFELMSTLNPDEQLHLSAIFVLLESYEKTVDDAIAQARFAQLETFIKRTSAYRRDMSLPLYSLILSVHKRGDDVAAQRLLEEHIDVIRAADNLHSQERILTISGWLSIHSEMQNEKIRQEGLEFVRLLVTEFFDPPERQQFEDLIILIDAGIW